MAKQRITEGAILEINIENQYYVYAQILGKAGYAFFDIKSEQKLSDFSILEKTKILFFVSVYNDVITEGNWLKIGKLPIREDLKIQPMQFIQDPINQNNFELYNPNTGDITKATRRECEGLECAAVWEGSHVEERIRDHYLGEPNFWVQKLAIK
jgi:hypothetical protein